MGSRAGGQPEGVLPVRSRLPCLDERPRPRQHRQRLVGHVPDRLRHAARLRLVEGRRRRVHPGAGARGRAHGITVNAIAPGAFPTDAEKIQPDPEGYNSWVLEQQCLQRRGAPDDIGNLVVFLSSDASSFITGSDRRHRRRLGDGDYGGWARSTARSRSSPRVPARDRRGHRARAGRGGRRSRDDHDQPGGRARSGAARHAGFALRYHHPPPSPTPPPPPTPPSTTTLLPPSRRSRPAGGHAGPSAVQREQGGDRRADPRARGRVAGAASA